MDIATTELAFKILRGEVIPPGSVRARWAMGSKRPGDIIWATSAAPLLVSERVVDILRKTDFTGWSTYDIALVGHDGAPIPGYQGLSVCGRCGPIDNSKSIELSTIVPGGVSTHWLGLYFDPGTWDGSDIFMPDEGRGGRILVTEDVKQAFKKAKVRNVEFTNLVEYERLML